MSISVLARKYNAIHDIKLIFSQNLFRYLTGKLAIISSNVYIFLKDKKANDNTYKTQSTGQVRWCAKGEGSTCKFSSDFSFCYWLFLEGEVLVSWCCLLLTRGVWSMHGIMKSLGAGLSQKLKDVPYCF